MVWLCLYWFPHSLCSLHVTMSSAQFKWTVTMTSAANTVCQVLYNVRKCKKRETKSRAACLFLLRHPAGISLFSLLCLNQFSSYLIHSPNGGPSGRLTLDRLGNKPLTGGIKTEWEIKKKIVQKNSVGVWRFKQQPNIQGQGCL